MTGWTYLDTLPSDLILNEGVLALVSEADSGSVPTLQSAARERQVDLLGAIVPGLVIEDEFRRRGTLLVPLQSVPRVMVPVPEADHTPNETIEALADFVLEHAAEGGGDTLMLLVDATIADVASILARLYMEVGDQVNYAGCLRRQRDLRTGSLLVRRRGLPRSRHPGAAASRTSRRHPGPWLSRERRLVGGYRHSG